MLQLILIGHIGADAEVKNDNGREFTAFRVAHTDKWTDQDGHTVETTSWVDVIMNGKPNVLPYLKKGQMVYVAGSMRLRVYSSAKDRCMKAGVSVSASRVELLGSKSDDIPAVLYSEDGKEEIRVGKFFYAPAAIEEGGKQKYSKLVSRSGESFAVDKDGWVTRSQEKTE